ncbi:MAG: anti-anti-sigma factor [Paraglaciecola sp.]|jgi:anti-anti-sigma factor
MSFDRAFSDDGKQLTIIVDEKFDFGNVTDFRVAYSNDSDEVKSIVVDLQRTKYIDSSALGMLLNMQKVMSGNVTSFSIINCCEQVTKILRIARFDKKFTLS